MRSRLRSDTAPNTTSLQSWGRGFWLAIELSDQHVLSVTESTTICREVERVPSLQVEGHETGRKFLSESDTLLEGGLSC